MTTRFLFGTHSALHRSHPVRQFKVWTGRKPTKRTQEMLCYLLMGWATADDVATHVDKLQRHDEQQAAKNI